MAGHSKWANIKHKKERADSKRGKVFTKLGREIAVAVKEGGSDIEANSKLRDIVTKAKANNMPSDTIARSIKKAAGELGAINYETVVYEGYGAGGVAVIVESLTDNRNRTAGEVRHSFDKNKGSLGATGCVSFLFERKGVIVIEKNEDLDQDTLMLSAIEAGALDIQEDEEIIEITTDTQSFSNVCETLENEGYMFALAEVQMVASNSVEVSGENEENLQGLLDMLEDCDDVQNVYHNAVFAE